MLAKFAAPTRVGDGVDRFAWFDKTGRAHYCRSTDVTRLRRELPARPARKAPKYKGQTSFQGHYWFAGVQRHVWHESMAEYSALMLLDHRRTICAVTDQPFRMSFADGTTHVPDYLMEDSDGTWIVVDVHLRSRTTEAQALSFEATRRVCNNLGWDYVLLDQLSNIVNWNLEMMARYRHPMFAPAPGTRDFLLANAAANPRYGTLCDVIKTEKPGEHIPAISHLMWQRSLLFDLTQPFTEDSFVAVA